MELRILQKSDLDDVLKTQGIKSIWQRDRLIDNAVADPATKKYIENVLSGNRSLGIFNEDRLISFVLGSMPEWDSKHFGYESYVVRNAWGESDDSLKKLLSDFDKYMLDWKVRYTYARVPADEKSRIRLFEKIGFDLADFRVMFNRKLKNEKPFPTNSGDLKYSMATKEDTEELAELSKLVSKVDRFHSDPNVSQDLADEVYYLWVKNGVKAGKDVVKCTIDGELAGFHMSYPEKSLEKDGLSSLSISDIMGVYPKFGGKGIGTGLFVNYFALAESKGQQSVLAGVHVDNVISMRLHEGVGFKVTYTEIGLRKWYS